MVVALGVLGVELMSVLGVVEPEAPMAVPLPVVPEAVLSVLGVVEAVLSVLGVVLGVVVLAVSELVVGGTDGVVVDVVEVDVSVVVTRSPQAARVIAAITARAATRAVGDLIMRYSLRRGSNAFVGQRATSRLPWLILFTSQRGPVGSC